MDTVDTVDTVGTVGIVGVVGTVESSCKEVICNCVSFRKREQRLEWKRKTQYRTGEGTECE